MRWRLHLDGPHDAPTNMARDEALFRSALSQASPPTVRLYYWSRPSVSIGYRQAIDEACDVEQCRQLGVDTVRRISGGRAVLHQHELTYCLCSPAVGLFRGLSVRGIYAKVTGVIRAALESMTIPVDPPAEKQGNRNRLEPPQALPCFVVPTGHEITAGGKKLVGSAQKWSRGGFLQHGSILLALDPRLWRQTTRLSPATELGAVSLETLAGKEIAKDDLIQALDGAFREFFGEPSTSSSLSPEEKEMAHLLAEKKYRSTSWNVGREARDRL